MNTRPRPATAGGAFHVAHTPTADDATTLTLSVAQHRVGQGAAPRDADGYGRSELTLWGPFGIQHSCAAGTESKRRFGAESPPGRHTAR
jgi:hypothetical protein